MNYIFKYDERPGTRAVGYPDDIEVAVKKERHRLLMETAERVQRARFEGWRGRTARVFVESVSTRDDRIVLGRSVHGMPVSLPGDASLVGTYASVLLEECTAYGLSGRIAEAPAEA